MDAMRLGPFEIVTLGKDEIVLSDIGIIEKKTEIPQIMIDSNRNHKPWHIHETYAIGVDYVGHS